jgi:methionyl-tRNA synthetase
VIAAHAWIVLGSGEKLSKSKGNQVIPAELSESLATRSGCHPQVAVDAVRHYLAATMPFENDTTFTHEEFDRRYNNDLANDLGNALNRTLAMAHRFVGGRIPQSEPEAPAKEAIELARLRYQAAMDGFRLEQASDAALGLIRFLNKYIDTRAPWLLAKSEDPELAGVMASMLHCVRSGEAMMRPFMPYAADQIAHQLDLPPLTAWSQIGTPGSLPYGHALGQPKPIFPRLEIEKSAPKPKTKMPEPNPSSEKAPNPKTAPSEPIVSEITIEDFAKVQLRVARVVEAEILEGSDKLLKLQLLIGEVPRQIVAGIRKNYSPEDLIGRQVIVVANLKPAKLRGVESQGMLVAAVSEDGGAILLQPDEEAPEGARVR